MPLPTVDFATTLSIVVSQNNRPPRPQRLHTYSIHALQHFVPDHGQAGEAAARSRLRIKLRRGSMREQHVARD